MLGLLHAVAAVIPEDGAMSRRFDGLRFLLGGESRRTGFVPAAAVLLSALVGLVLLACELVREDPANSEPAEEGPPFAESDWQYITVDNDRAKWGDFAEPGWLRYFGLASGDLTGDRYPDLVSGRYFYRNPGGDLSGRWARRDLGRNLDAILVTDVDGDARGDIIAQALPDILWVEAADERGDAWVVRKVAEAPVTSHVNSQGFRLGQLVPGGKPEIVVASGNGIYYFEIPDAPDSAPWQGTLVTMDATDEGLAIADIDGDGLSDVVAAKGAGYVAWWKNPGQGIAEWPRNEIGATEPLDVDRIETADIDGDGRTDVVVTQELVADVRPNASLYWFRQPADATSARWPRQRLLTEYSLNSLDAADVDGDGDVDLVTGEHKGPHLRLQLLENNGYGRFLVREIDRGKESHLGALAVDLDADGDRDIVSIAWDRYQDLHLWRNDRIEALEPVCWRQFSNHAGAFARAGVGQQSSAVAMDIDLDGRDDFLIAGWDRETSMVWFRSSPGSMERHLIDDRESHIEAGGVSFDLDGDGDPDIVQGGSWNTNQLWWWENPHPNHLPNQSWNRHTIKDGGEKQHHDQIVGDFDGDGSAELVFWNQQARTLFLADVPDRPRDQTAWEPVAIWTWPDGSNYEGLAKSDVDLDGKVDLIGGGRWFKHIVGNEFQPQVVDEAYGFSRSAVGDVIEGGRPEILLGSGDSRGPLNLYEWRGNTWKRSRLIADLDHGHTLQVEDINADGHLDIYTAEMHTPGSGRLCRQLLLYGDGRGGFERQVISTGIGTHEGKLGDFDGDGDLDILQKDFQNDRRVDIWFNDGRSACSGSPADPVAEP